MPEKQIIHFIGAGPGDPELITLKGRRLLEAADLIVYAGSLINPAVLEGLRAELHDSAALSLEQTTALLRDAALAGKRAVRLHSGDISFYSAITEQIARLAEHGISSEVVPGVSSLSAGAAAMGQELTIPEVSQTVIVTRMAGRTPVPEAEALHKLASHQATMAVFLSIGMIEEVVSELLLGGYKPDTPVVVIEKASWPGSRMVRADLSSIAQKVKEAGITKTALIYVGRALLAQGAESKLYDKDFKHGYRH